MAVIVLDNDETTGYYPHLMTYMSFAMRGLVLTADQEISIIQTITDIANTSGVFRPGTDTFLQAIAERKKLGLVNSVVMYTNALANPDMSWYTTSGIVDWPHFLARVLSCLAGDPTFFDVVLSRPPHLAHVAYPKKNFARVTEALAAAGRPVTDDQRIFFFDDKPDEILGATERFVAWRAPEYKAPITVAQIDAMLARILPDGCVYRWAEFTLPVIREEIYAMTARCKDASIPAPAPPAADGHWCGFDLDVHIPLPAPPTLVIETEEVVQPPINYEHKHKDKTRRIRIQLELALNISVGRRHKKHWSVTAPLRANIFMHQPRHHSRMNKHH